MARQVTRRSFLAQIGTAASVSLSGPLWAQAQQPPEPDVLSVDSSPQHDLSPYLYMQFMEPLGTTDGSVAAAWDFGHDCWRSDVIEITRSLGPTLMRWGGCFSSYYRWKEAVGPRADRNPMLNLCWGGIESNQVGTQEFVDFCNRVDADPLMCVNFESDGRAHWQQDPKGSDRRGDASEAAQWVSFCNNPQDPLRKQYAIAQCCRIPIWQIGNETSYSRGAFGAEDSAKCVEIAARKTVEFAQAMRQADPHISLIGWGDSGWSRRMLEIAGEHLQYIAFHHMFNPDRGEKDSPLEGIHYRDDPDRTWSHLMRAAEVHNARIQRVRDEITGLETPLAMTECHFALPGRNRNEVLSTWAAGVANARMLNVHERHGDKLKIATLADFCGTRWQVNAVMIPVPGGKAFLMPVALVMSLYRHHSGAKSLRVNMAPAGLDVTASCTDDRIFLHVVNTLRTEAVTTRLQVQDMSVKQGKVYQLAASPETEVLGRGAIRLTEHVLAQAQWQFPAASVSAVELQVADRIQPAEESSAHIHDNHVG